MMRVCRHRRDASVTILRVQVLICFGILISGATSCGTGKTNTPPAAPPLAAWLSIHTADRHHLVSVIESSPCSACARSAAFRLE